MGYRKKQQHQPDRIRLHVIDDEIVNEHNRPSQEGSDNRLRVLHNLLVDELEGYEIDLMPSYISPQELKEILDLIEVETIRRKQKCHLEEHNDSGSTLIYKEK